MFEPHSLSCVESLTFIRDGINYHPKYSPRGRVSLRFAPIEKQRRFMMFGRIVDFTPKPEMKDEIVNVLRKEVLPS